MGLIDLTKDLENIVAGHYSDARGPVVRGEHTELSMIRFSAGEGAEEHSHREEQFVFVLEGTIRFDMDGASTDVREGQAFFVPSDTPHATRSSDGCRAISFKNLVAPSYDATQSAAAD